MNAAKKTVPQGHGVWYPLIFAAEPRLVFVRIVLFCFQNSICQVCPEDVA
jgi:hypothetical protein